MRRSGTETLIDNTGVDTREDRSVLSKVCKTL